MRHILVEKTSFHNYERWFQSVLIESEVLYLKQKSNSIFFTINKVIVFEYLIQTRQFFISYQKVLMIFEIDFQLDMYCILKFAKKIIEKNFKWSGVKPNYGMSVESSVYNKKINNGQKYFN